MRRNCTAFPRGRPPHSRPRASCAERGIAQLTHHLPSPPAEATSQWKKYSYVFLPVVVVFGVVTMGKHFMHGHHHGEEIPFPYMKKRDKAMPWALKGGSKCDLFDYDCSAKERALKAGVEPAHH